MTQARWRKLRQALFDGNGIARRLLLSVVAFSTLITALITAQDLYAGYRSDVRGIEDGFRFVDESYAPSLSRSVWQFDEELVRSQLQGMLRLPDVEFAEVAVDGRLRWSAGVVTSPRVIQTQIALMHESPSGRRQIGTLRVVASTDRALARVWQRLLFELLSNGVKTLLVAGFLLLVFQTLVTRHLVAVARFVRAIDPAASRDDQPTLTLDRPAQGRWRPDVLDVVVQSINDLQSSLHATRARLAQTHRSLAESELRMRLGLEAAAAGVWDCDLLTRRVLANDACASILGLTSYDLRQDLSYWRDLIHPEDLATALAELQRHLEGFTPHMYTERRMRHATLGWRWISLRGRVVERSARGTPLRAVGTMVDITSRREAEDALRASEARLLALTAHTSALIYEVDGDGRVVFANREGGSLASPVTGSFSAQWLPATQRIRFDQALRAALTDNRRDSYELMLVDERGSDRHYKLTVAPMAARRTAVVTALDITEIKAAEEALREANRLLESRVSDRTAALEAARDEAQRANRAKSEFLSRMSHELRTPMNAILGFAQILQMSEPDAAGHRKWVAEIQRAGEHLLKLIDDLLDMARIDVGKLGIRTESVELRPLIEEAVSLCRPLLQGRDVALAVDSSECSTWVRSDRTRLRQILVNLLSNAIKYNRDGGSVRVAYRALAQERVQVTVTDTGSGLTPEQMARLFVPFERLGREESTVGGTGIGLALSKRLAELMGAQLGVQSSAGEGSTFWISLPLALAPSQALADAAPTLPQPPPRALRMLYVEDNAANLALMQAYFDRWPQACLLCAPDGKRGVQVAISQQPDLIFLDIQLPEMDGYAVLSALRSNAATCHIPVVAVTADAMPQDVERAASAGFDAYLVKPIRLSEVAKLIDELAPKAPTRTSVAR